MALADVIQAQMLPLNFILLLISSELQTSTRFLKTLFLNSCALLPVQQLFPLSLINSMVNALAISATLHRYQTPSAGSHVSVSFQVQFRPTL